MNTLFDIWNNIQSTLFPWLEEELCRSDTAGSKYVNRRSDCTIWHASVGYVSDILRAGPREILMGVVFLWA